MPEYKVQAVQGLSYLFSVELMGISDFIDVPVKLNSYGNNDPAEWGSRPSALCGG